MLSVSHPRYRPDDRTGESESTDFLLIETDLTAWLDQKKLAAVLTNGSVGLCSTTMLVRDLTLLPLMADGLELVALFVLTVL